MKIILILFAFVLTIGATKAQDTKPSFEETVNYINNIFKENKKLNICARGGKNSRGELCHGITASKNGKVVFCSHLPTTSTGVTNDEYAIFSINLFDFEKIDMPDHHDWRNILDKNNNSIGLISDLPASYVSKLVNAFKHLRTFCTKEKDPFE